MLTLKNKTKQKVAKWPWQDVTTAILGEKYELSLTFVGDALSRRLNNEHRGKDKPTNVLAFPLTKTMGDIFINLNLAKQEAANFDHTYHQQVLFLFIHGLLHLKGLDHGSTMERKEREFFTRFSL